MPQPGTLIEGKYEIVEKIREGGMGTIYKVRHRLLDEIRVVKVLRPHVVADADLKRRFVDEAKTATRLKHPNIGTIHDFAIDEEGTAYLVMEYIEGANLAELLQARGRPGIPLTLEIGHQALLALGYLHRKSVVHRDVAPDNLMLTRDEEGRPLIKLIDLGIAKALDKSADLTSTGVFLGKLKYASPEQYGSLPAGEKLDGRSDLYGLGIVLYELLTGSRPFVGDSAAELLRAHLFQPPLPFSETDPEGKVPPELRAVVLKALEKKRADRFATAEEFDREILVLKQRFSAADDPENTVAMLGVPRMTPAADILVTPSAQDRLDRHFLAHSTPSPTPSATGSLPVDSEPTVGSPAPIRPVPFASGGPARHEPTVTTTPLPRSTPRRIPRLWIAALAAVAVLVAVLLLELRSRGPRPDSAPRDSAAALPTAAAAPPASDSAGPVETPVPEPTGASEPVPTAPPSTVSPAPPEETGAADRAAAEQARTRASRQRAEAERRRAPSLASEEFGRARSKQREGETQFARRNYPSAGAAFELSRQLFQGAAFAAQRAASSRLALSPSPAAAALPTPLATARAEPTAIAAIRPTSGVPPTAAPPSPSSAPRPAVAPDQEKIRETLHRYERALSTLDADLYARAVPGVDRTRIRAAFENFRSQSVELEIRRIDVDPGGGAAIVRGYEKRLAMPHAGSEQRWSGERTITLEKRGEAWIITGVN